MLDFLKAVAKVEQSEDDKLAMMSYLQKNVRCPDYINALFFNRIHYLFMKHVIEQNQIQLLKKHLHIVP